MSYSPGFFLNREKTIYVNIFMHIHYIKRFRLITSQSPVLYLNHVLIEAFYNKYP